MDAKLNDVNEPCLTLGTGEVKDSPSKKAKAHLESSTAKPKETDVFRDTPVRLLGYANEVGEAFRSLVPRYIVNSSYAIASTYALSDATSKALHLYNKKRDEDDKPRLRASIEMFVEAAVWQGLASVIIPGFTINRICALSTLLLGKLASGVPLGSRQWTVTCIGLAAIPLIIKPIDRIHQEGDSGCTSTTTANHYLATFWDSSESVQKYACRFNTERIF